MAGKKRPRTDKEKRDRMKSRNPRGNKRGGKKSIKFHRYQEKPTDFSWELHLKYHHNPKHRHYKKCEERKCPMFGRISTTKY